MLIDKEILADLDAELDDYQPVPRLHRAAINWSNELGKPTPLEHVGIAQPSNDFLREFGELLDHAMQIVRAKNADYANDADPFANFKLAELVGVSVEKGMLVRMTDKLKRIANLLDKPPAVAGESREDTCLDLAIYSLILLIWLRHK